MKGCSWAPVGQPASSAMMSEGDHTLGFREAEGVGIGAVVVFVITPLAVVAVPACWAVPDGVGGVELFTEATAVREWEGSLRTTGRYFFVVILRCSEPPECSG